MYGILFYKFADSYLSTYSSSRNSATFGRAWTIILLSGDENCSSFYENLNFDRL